MCSSPSAIAATIANSLQEALGMLGTDVLEIVQKAVGVSDILLGQMISLMDSEFTLPGEKSINSS